VLGSRATLGVAMIVGICIFDWLQRPMARALLFSSLGLAALIGSLSARRAWVDEDSLWSYSVRVEPKATLHQRNASNTFFRADDLDRGAYHRLIDVYLLNRFPAPVQWAEIESTSSLSPLERFVELPAILEPDDPCALVRVFTKEAKQYQPLYGHVVEHCGPRYPACGRWAP
jgi:hypothetical protein